LIALTGLGLALSCSRGGSDTKDHASAKRVLYYVDPMHPAYRSDKPGKAPDCGMDLEPVYEDAKPVGDKEKPSGAVSISPEKQQLMGLLVETVKENAEPRTLRTTGRVEVVVGRLQVLQAGADGWVESVENSPVGTMVKKDERLATLFSREFRNAQQAYLGSLNLADRTKPLDEDAGLKLNEDQLRALGMGEAQIKELRKTRKITSEITLNAPFDGIVLDREISKGQRFEPGNVFYRIADLSRVWITADVLDQEAQAFHPCAKARVFGRERAVAVDATIGAAPPFFDSATRTLKVRLEAANPGLVLRPDMLVDVELSVGGAPSLTVPLDALLDSGLTERVFVERAEGEFEPRVVRTGWRSGDRVEIVSGLKAGERVVTRGTFLVDSESRLKTR
jgi:RND family efflux transporter MFP subunit